VIGNCYANSSLFFFKAASMDGNISLHMYHNGRFMTARVHEYERGGTQSESEHD